MLVSLREPAGFMLTITKARKILGKEAHSLTDSQVEGIMRDVTVLADIFLNLESKKGSKSKNGLLTMGKVR